ncbi:MAG: ScyD/ScyE family protein [Acidimicrobiia bacterium]|nr:ScyD/ScyE family protein [Acidimicrobiia bacterium]
MHRNRRPGARRWTRALGAGVLASGLLALAPSTPASATGPYEIVAEGLDNPRGIALGRMGRVYVAEAGRGGDTCIDSVDPETGEPVPQCIGDTGSITLINRNGQVREVIGGLPSLAGEDGSAATGVHDVTVDEGIHLLVGNVGDVLGVPAELQDERFGKLFRRRGDSGGEITEVADISAVEEAENPDGIVVDTNPYGLQTDRRGNHYATDAGGNDLLRVTRDGEVSVTSVLQGGEAEAPPFLGLPPGAKIPYQPVPTSVDVGPDGRPYVGLLTGFPFPLDQSVVYRITPGGRQVFYASAFTNVIDVTFGPGGKLYVLELAKQGLLTDTGGPPLGALYEVDPGGGTKRLISGPELVLPGGVAVAGNGDVYVTINSILPGGGAVLRYDR